MLVEGGGGGWTRESKPPKHITLQTAVASGAVPFCYRRESKGALVAQH